MIPPLLIAAYFLPAVFAQTTSHTFFFLDGFDPQPLAASVITAAPSSTEFLLACPSSVSAQDCGIGPAFTITHAPGPDEQDVWQFSYAPSGEEFTMSDSCSVGHGTKAVCLESNGGKEANFPGSSTTTYEGASVQDMFLPVTITAGLEKLSSATNSPSGSVATASSGSNTGTVAATTGSKSSTGATATPTTSSNGCERAKVRYGAVIAVVGAVWMLL
ncbi:MAG: hypothetical protein M1822_002606 [Bathelium mastoideum]|nr:MAG: hypothetical protein M1822_002606 [Bathelium mastoideum]